MRGMALAMATTVMLATACSSESHGPLVGPSGNPTTTAGRWEGSKACPVGLVRVQVTLPQGSLLDPTIFYPGQGIVHITIDGFAHVRAGPSRFRVDGREVLLQPSLTGTEVEVFAGLGGDCDWVSVHPIL